MPLAVLILPLTALLLLAAVRAGWLPTPAGGLLASSAPPPRWVQQLVEQVGDGNSIARGERGTPYRAVVEAVFNGTRVDGYPAGVPSGDDFIADHDGEKVPGQFGRVILSNNARMLEAAYAASGFEHDTRYHGTENVFMPSILAGGFLISDGWHGKGVYTTKTFAHSQCYSEGEGGPILEVHVYAKPGDGKGRYTKHVPHNSDANDVYLVSDPLLIIPKEVHRCCPQKLTCIR